MSPVSQVDSLPSELSGKGMAAHSSILAWKIPWIVESGGLQVMHGVAESVTAEHTCAHAILRQNRNF